MSNINKEFYLLSPEIVAKELIGKAISFDRGNDELFAKIVETEAYLAKGDEASHSFKGKSLRNAPMFEEGGILYVYKIYGVHHCINIVTQQAGIGSAVLIRAVEPINGIEIMKKNRGVYEKSKLCNGPGNLSKAFGFDLSHNYRDLLKSDVRIKEFEKVKDSRIQSTKRIGITKSQNLPLRFYLIDSIWVSRKK